MTPSALSTILLRFIALGVAVCGMALIARGIFIHLKAHQWATNLSTLLEVQYRESPGILITRPFAKVAATHYVVGGAIVLAGSLLYFGSSRLGALIARDA
jgi:hypothetical protein